MKSGRSLQQMAAELERQQETKKDYLAAQGVLRAVSDQGTVKIDGLNGEPFDILPHAHSQIGTFLEIPAKYYDRMRVEQPELLATNINTWFSASGNDKRMIRTLDRKVRAFMSPKYRPLDNFDLAQSVLPTLIDRGVQVMSAELTETRMYIKGILPELSDILIGENGDRQWAGQMTAGDRGHVVSAIVISNSEVGAGSLRVEPSVFTAFCTNLAILANAAMKKYHVGKTFEADNSYEVFRDATRQADDKAFFMKVVDITKAAFDEDAFHRAINELRKTADNPIKSDDLPKVIELTVKRLALPQSTGGSILKHLAAGGDLTQWGLASAVTRTANDFEDYEGATDLERAGGAILALPPSEWKVFSEASA